MSFSLNISDIQSTRDNFGDVVEKTPLQYSPRLSEKYAAHIYLKREDLQRVRSYKIRGAYALISGLSDGEKNK